ncbi:MAG TPA: pitrilysin family protein [Parafilimonas sp.]|nr:pitrilysin family protein [Parafilimonas sp.]
MIINSSFRFTTIILFVALLNNANAQTAVKSNAAVITSFQKSNYTIPAKEFVLKNGLTLIVHEDHSAPVVSVNIWYHVGSKNEKRGRTGFAHLFEHFFFNGSDNYPHGFREAMDDVGANNRNGTTNNDRTNFFEDVPVSALERTLYLEADRMGFLTLSKDMLERERGVVQNEKRQGENQPLGKAFNELPGKLYPYAHPYSWSVIGSMDDLNAALIDDVKTWYQSYYGPNNAVIVLAGDITADSAQSLVRKYFEGIKPVPPISRLDSWVPALPNNIRDEVQDRIPQTIIFHIYHIPGWKSKELEYLKLFADIAGGSETTPLYKKLVYEKKLADNAAAWVDDQELSSLLYLQVVVKNGIDPALAEKEMDSVVNKILRDGISKDELEKARNRYLADFSRRMERTGGMGGRSDVLAESMTYGGSATAYLDKLEWIGTSKPADIKSSAQKWLSLPHYTLRVNPYPEIDAAQTDVDRSKLPALSTQPNAMFPVIQKATLKNGLTVMLLERNTAPIVNITLAVNAGISSDALAKAGRAALALNMLDKGTSTKDLDAISSQLDINGAELNTRSDQDFSYVQLKALKQNLQPSLNILSDIVLHPSFPEDQFKILKEQQLTDIDFEKSEPNSLVSRNLPALIYGKDHAYAMPQSGTGYTASVKELTRNDLVSWHDTWFKPGSSTLIVTGNVSMNVLLPALETAFGNWKQGVAPGKNIQAISPTKGGKVYLIDKPEATQSVIVAAQVSLPGGRPNEAAIQTFMQNFGGMSTSRLNRNLRLDKHWSYGSGAFLTQTKGQRILEVIAPVQTDKTKESMIEVSKEIKDVAGARPLQGEEYNSIMRNMSLRLPARFSTLQSLENAAVNVVNYNLPDDYWQHYAVKVRSSTEQDLNEASKEVVHPDEMIWLIVGDLKKVEAGIRELNFGEVIKLDADGNVIP